MRDFFTQPEFSGFSDLDDVAQQFETNLDGIIPLWCAYESESYEGSAACWFEKDGQLMYVDGSHCSCHGLEGQWSEETYFPVQFDKLSSYCVRPSTEFIDWCKQRYDDKGVVRSS